MAPRNGVRKILLTYQKSGSLINCGGSFQLKPKSTNEQQCATYVESNKHLILATCNPLSISSILPFSDLTSPFSTEVLPIRLSGLAASRTVNRLASLDCIRRPIGIRQLLSINALVKDCKQKQLELVLYDNQDGRLSTHHLLSLLRTRPNMAYQGRPTNEHADKDGHFRCKDSSFRDFILKDPSSKFPAVKGRYALYVNLGCPWVSLTTPANIFLSLCFCLLDPALFETIHSEISRHWRKHKELLSPTPISNLTGSAFHINHAH